MHKIIRKIGSKLKKSFRKRCVALSRAEVITPKDRRYVIFMIHFLSSLPGNKARAAREMERIKKLLKENLSEAELADADRVARLTDDMRFCNRVYGFRFQEYFTYGLEKLSHAGRVTFISTRSRRSYYKYLNNQNYTSYLIRKTEMYRKFGELYGRDALPIYDESDEDAFREFVKKHPKFIYKQVDEFGKTEIKFVDSAKTVGSSALFDILITMGCGIVEELIDQDEALAQFHPKSVNTVRAITFLNSEGEAEIQWCFLRMGTGANRTDNASSSLMAMIDSETGIVCQPGRNGKGDTFLCHPDTGAQIVGFKMPEWDKAKELLGKAANVIPQLRLVGWDLAYSKDGWVLVDGNSIPQYIYPQISAYNGNLHLLESMKKQVQAERRTKSN